jgi:hypothetical protein
VTGSEPTRDRPHIPGYSIPKRLRPAVAFGWGLATGFKDATRWRFGER